MTDKIAEIRGRHQRIETTDDTLLVNLEFSWANDDRGWLLAEVERLTRERDAARAEVERLREVIRTIRARCVEMDDSDAVSETLDISSAALEDEP